MECACDATLQQERKRTGGGAEEGTEREEEKGRGGGGVTRGRKEGEAQPTATGATRDCHGRWEGWRQGEREPTPAETAAQRRGGHRHGMRGARACRLLNAPFQGRRRRPGDHPPTRGGSSRSQRPASGATAEVHSVTRWQRSTSGGGWWWYTVQKRVGGGGPSRARGGDGVRWRWRPATFWGGARAAAKRHVPRPRGGAEGGRGQAPLSLSFRHKLVTRFHVYCKSS